jgi:hypothetical protein
MERPAHDRNVVGMANGKPQAQNPRNSRVSARGARAAYESSRSMGIIWVGMDAHKKAINVAALFPDEREPHEWTLENKPAGIRRLVKKLVREAEGTEVRCCYEAGQQLTHEPKLPTRKRKLLRPNPVGAPVG